MFTQLLPINSKTFSYNKKEYNEDLLKLKARMTRDIYNFFNDNRELFSDAKLLVYYDNGQQELNKIITSVFSILFRNVEFRKVHPSDYKLFQFADLICTWELLALKAIQKKFTESEKAFFGSSSRFLKNRYKLIVRKRLGQ